MQKPGLSFLEQTGSREGWDLSGAEGVFGFGIGRERNEAKTIDTENVLLMGSPSPQSRGVQRLSVSTKSTCGISAIKVSYAESSAFILRNIYHF